MKYSYLLIDLGAILVPFIYSFHPRVNFHKKWSSFWPACLIAAAIFIAWDILYTDLGVWGFNPDYLTGLYLFNLPIEEVLFFICIPYACVFTYHCFRELYNIPFFHSEDRFLTLFLAALLAVLGTTFLENLYTSVTFISLSLFLIALRYHLQVSWLNYFYFSYLILLLPFFITNGMLTGTGFEEAIVWYDDNENMGIRILTIPVEDIFYGMLLIILNVSMFEYFKKRKISKLQEVSS